MKLKLDRIDLKPEFAGLPMRAIKFEHLDDTAQAAVKAVGRGTIYEFDGSNYNAIYAPKEQP